MFRYLMPIAVILPCMAHAQTPQDFTAQAAANMAQQLTLAMIGQSADAMQCRAELAKLKAEPAKSDAGTPPK